MAGVNGALGDVSLDVSGCDGATTLSYPIGSNGLVGLDKSMALSLHSFMPTDDVMDATPDGDVNKISIPVVDASEETERLFE